MKNSIEKKFYLLSAFFLIFSMSAKSKTLVDTLSEIEAERLNIRMETKADDTSQKLKNLSEATFSLLGGVKKNITLDKSATLQERERATYHILSSYITEYKSMYGNQQRFDWNQFNENFTKYICPDYLTATSDYSRRYTSHLAALYVMHLGAYQLVKTPRSYFWHSESPGLQVAIKLKEKLRSKILPDYLMDYFRNKMEASKATSDAFEQYISLCLGKNFFKQYLSLIPDFKDTSETDKSLFEISQQRKLSLAHFHNNLPDNERFFPTQDISSLNKPLLDGIKKVIENALITNMGSQSVHTFNRILAPAYKEQVLTEAQKFFSPRKDLAVEEIKKSIYEYFDKNFAFFENISPGKRPYRQSIDISFKNLEGHLRQSIIENSETKLNVPEIMSMVWDVSNRLQELRNKKKDTILKPLVLMYREKPDYPPKSREALFNKDIKNVIDNITSETDDARSRMVGSFAENERAGGWCYPGIAGRLFSDYCNLLLDYFFQDCEYFTFKPLKKTITSQRLSLYLDDMNKS